MNNFKEWALLWLFIIAVSNMMSCAELGKVKRELQSIDRHIQSQ